jgi:exosortase/archaeosortase family protein
MDTLRGSQPESARDARFNVLLRAIYAVTLVLFLITILMHENTIRCGEARVAAWLVDSSPGPAAYALNGEPVFFIIGREGSIGLNVTPECTVALLILPFLACTVLLLAVRRIQLPRLLAGLTISIAVLVGVNQLRLVSVSWASYYFGSTGYEWSHTLGGSILSIVGMVFTMFIYVKICFVNSKGMGLKPVPA